MAHSPGNPVARSDEVRPAVAAWFSRRRLGLFLHYGLYAIEGWHEQDQMRRRIPREAYEPLAERFDPSAFDATAIVDFAKSAGMEYVCMTTKHHDGYCLWDTEETSYKSGRDLVRELADACHAGGVALGLYYSVVDWHHPAYPNQGRHHEVPTPAGDEPDMDQYVEHVRRQVRELATRYGEVKHFFWDMNVPEHLDQSVNAMLRELQPGIVINDRGFDPGDFGTPERAYQKAATDAVVTFIGPTEACNSVGSQSWGFREHETYFTPRFLMGEIARTFAKGGHYLLNVGPAADGSIPGRPREIVETVGRWYRSVAEAYGDARPFSNVLANDFLTTRRGNRLFLHFPDGLGQDGIVLPALAEAPSGAVLLNTGAEPKCAMEQLPTHWETRSEVCVVRGLPADGLPGEVPVVRLEFPHSPRFHGQAADAFEG